MIESQEVHFIPTKKYIHTTKLRKLTTLLSRWKRAVVEPNTIHLSVSFRTLQLNSRLLTVQGSSGTFTNLELIEGILYYRSQGSGKPAINMTTDINVADGSWHKIELSVVNNVLKVFLDDDRVGFEVEFSAAHNFLGPKVQKFVFGDASERGILNWMFNVFFSLTFRPFAGFRGCLGNFTINNELQSLSGDRQLLKADAPAGLNSHGCDVEVLSVAEPRNSVDIGVTVVVIFFVLLLCALAGSFTYYKLRRKFKQEKTNSGPKAQNNRGFDMGDENMPPLNNSRIPLTTPKHKKPQQQPDVIDDSFGLRTVESPSRQPTLPITGASNIMDPDPLYEPEHYDIDNASSIAPSDIDIVYHYKGYRDGGGNHRFGNVSLPKKKKNIHMNTPLARLSPSSEISRNTPRILTLGDLSGKPLPSALLTEQSERSLNSPLSHISSAHSMSRGLTSENVARFNNQRSTPGVDQTSHTSGGRATKNSTLVNTLDLVSMGSGGKKVPAIEVPSSSSSENGDDSFTCSEFECESNTGSSHQLSGASMHKDFDASNGSAMVFSKLIDFPDAKSKKRAAPQRRNYDSSDATDEDVDDLDARRPTSTTSLGGKSWEHLLTWWPDYESFAGVFKDIAELPHTSSLDGDCRPNPLGDRRSAVAEEEYI